MAGQSEFAHLQDEIIERIAKGESLRAVCRTDGFPSPSLVIKWTTEDADFGKHYARACEARADVYFDSLDDVSADAASAETAVTVAGLRLKADNIKWQLARMAPKKYGDKIQTEVSGSMRVVSATELTDDELAAIATGSSG